MIEPLNSRQGLDGPVNEETETKGFVDGVAAMLQGRLSGCSGVGGNVF